ncbi:MAG: 23S rRNA (pseudouridine(1915)-N(3))-methyltransferase RlmH [Deltaproteobacteria bacterium]|nr:23S rRNA (pseudouridine(1915)-N(3))-methyltransferase RlmH [Deltaproteobacteria bacterium]
MKYRVITVGRRAKDPLVNAADTYSTRLNHYISTELIRLRDDTYEREHQMMLKHLKTNEILIVLDERGRQYSTTELANLLNHWQINYSNQNIAFVIGGANGLHEDIKKRAKEIWSLSRFTLPHRLALVVLLEQLYRAHTFLRGEPYHRE